MESWIIAESEATYTYFIPAEKAFWITEQAKENRIEELIDNQQLGVITEVPYHHISQIILIESDNSIEIDFKEDNDSEMDPIQFKKSDFIELRDYLKQNFQQVKVKEYTLFSRSKRS